MVPHVETVEEAATITDRLRYPPPLGHRGVFSIMPQFHYRPAADMTALLNQANLDCGDAGIGDRHRQCRDYSQPFPASTFC